MLWVMHRTIALCCLLVGCAGREYGARCDHNDECDDSLSCFGGELGCVYTCTVENDFSCPDGYGCVGPRDLEPKLCVKLCESDRDCPEEWVCASVTQEKFCSPR
jgi:hypothetical protein